MRWNATLRTDFFQNCRVGYWRSFWCCSTWRLCIRHFLYENQLNSQQRTRYNSYDNSQDCGALKAVTASLCSLFSLTLFLVFTSPQIDLHLSLGCVCVCVCVCSGRYWGFLLLRPAGNMDEWSQTDNLPADIDLTHITAAHNRHGIASPADKHSLKLD